VYSVQCGLIDPRLTKKNGALVGIFGLLEGSWGFC